MSDHSATERKQRWQERNQINAIHGALPVMPEDWEHIDSIAAKIDQCTFGADRSLVDNSIARAMAAEMVRFQRSQKVAFDTRWCTDFDETDPESTARIYVLAFGHCPLIPLTNIDQLREVADTMLPNPICDAFIVRECRKLCRAGEHLPAAAAAVPRGEIICIFNICEMCREAMSWITFGHPRYSGPYPWMDDGSRNSDNDLWTA